MGFEENTKKTHISKVPRELKQFQGNSNEILILKGFQKMMMYEANRSKNIRLYEETNRN